MASIGDLFYLLRADDSKLEADVTKAGESAGAKGGTAAGKKFSTTMGTAVRAGIGAAVGGIVSVGMAVALKGSAELNTAVSDFVADTGATAEEAAKAQHAIGETYKTTLATFGEIGDTLSVLRTDLGLTQDAADGAAKGFVRFAEVAGGTGAEAVLRFDDLLDGLNLDASKAPGIMDQLVASHQKYGGSINENIDALTAMAPALNAANLSVDDGVGLLNMFASAGVDASAAPAALSKALGKVKSPEELKLLLTDIGAIEDPFARAQAAADLFGAKAGPKMAQALSQGTIADFTIGVDEAAGAADRAAGAIEGSFGNQAQLVLKQFGGTLAEIGTNFGPLLIGFAAMLPALTPILGTVGAGLGGVLAAAIPIGMAALPVLLVAAVVAAIAFLVANPEIVGKIGDFARDVLGAIGRFLSGLPKLLGDVFGKAFNAVVAAAPGFIEKLVGFILTLPIKILQLQGKVLEIFAGLFLKVLGAFPGFIASVVKWFMDLPGKIAELGPKLIKAIIDGLSGLGRRLLNIVHDAFMSIFPINIGPIHITSKGVEIDLPKIDLPHFAAGAWDLPADMVAVVHRGEMIVPAPEAEAIRSGARAGSSTTGETSGGNTYIVNVRGNVRARDPDEIGGVLRRLGQFGVLPPRPANG